jgi:hypothetical protein
MSPSSELSGTCRQEESALRGQNRPRRLRQSLAAVGKSLSNQNALSLQLKNEGLA